MANAEIERHLRNQLAAVVGDLGRVADALSHGEATSGRTPSRGDLLEDAQLAEAQEGGHLARERLARQAKGLLLALRRLEAGSYGVCIDCNKAIGAARLRAVPSAMRCLQCQRRAEDAIR